MFVSKNSGFRALVLHSRTNVPILSPDRQLRNNGTMARHGPDWTISSVLILELWRHGWRSYVPPLEHHTTAQMALARLNHKCWSSQRQQKWGCGRARLNSKIQAYAALLQSLEPASRLSTESFGARQLNFHVSAIKLMSRLLNMLLILSLFILYAFILELLPQSPDRSSVQETVTNGNTPVEAPESCPGATHAIVEASSVSSRSRLGHNLAHC